MTSPIKTRSSKLSETETQLIAAVRNVLHGEARAIFDAQAAAINIVNRHPNGTIVAFYRKRWWRANWNGIPMFPLADEFPLAEIAFKVGGKRFKAKLTCYGGRIFDFSISPSPKLVWNTQFDTPATVALLSDPLKSGTNPRPDEPIPKEWDELRNTLPPDAKSRWCLHGADSAYRLPMEDGEYLVLAERDGDEFLLWRVDPPDSSYYYMPEHDEEPKRLESAVSAILQSNSN